MRFAALRACVNDSATLDINVNASVKRIKDILFIMRHSKYIFLKLITRFSISDYN